MKRRNFITALGVTGGLAALGSSTATANPGRGRGNASGINNVIVMVGDGMGYDPIEATEFVHGDLAMKSMASIGKASTDTLSGDTTDSGAAATAIATGVKVHNQQISVFGPDGTEDVDEVTPLMTQLEAAAAVGKRTGLVSTVTSPHATPAGWGAHVPSRLWYDDIIDDYLENEIDLMLAGGKDDWSDEHLATAEELGYEIIHHADELADASDDRLVGLFADGDFPLVPSREERQPTLPTMSAEAIDRLEGDDGFFLMIEGARIDHANHMCDPWSSIADTKEFDDSVEIALDFAADRDDTLVVVLSDHECGGFAVGNDFLAGDSLSEEHLTEDSINVSMEEFAEGIAAEVEEGADVDIEERLDEQLLFDYELSDEKLADLQEVVDDGPGFWELEALIGTLISPQLGIGWGGQYPGDALWTSHTAPAQPVMAYGPGVDAAGAQWFHLTDLSATVSALMLFGTLDDMPDAERQQWERRIQRNGPSGDRDALRALEYLGPADDELAEALDVNGDGVVDLADVMEISDHADQSSGRAPHDAPHRGPRRIDIEDPLLQTHRSR